MNDNKIAIFAHQIALFISVEKRTLFSLRHLKSNELRSSNRMDNPSFPQPNSFEDSKIVNFQMQKEFRLIEIKFTIPVRPLPFV